jgi:rod shape-determining protein MreD
VEAADVTASRALTLARAAALVLVVLLVQVTIASDLHVLGVQPELLLLVAASAGVVAGPDRGAIVGFSAGLAYDIFLQTPFGLTALVYASVGYATGSVQLQLASQTRRARMSSVAVASAAGVLLWVAVGRVVDEAQVPLGSVVRVALVAGVLNGVVGLAGTRALAWVFAPGAQARA